MKKSIIITALMIMTTGVQLAQSGDATDATKAANEAVLKELPFEDTQSFKDARRGFIAKTDPLEIKDANGNTVWSLTPYGFLEGDAPATVNPSLWRQAQLNMNNGLFKVRERIYQLRGFDLSNMTIIEGNSGIIVIDPLMAAETAKAALALYFQHRPQKPVVAVIYTHSHMDHFAGVKGVISEEDVKSGKVKVIAPRGFLEAAIAENVYAGTAMGRRSTYMYAPFLPRGAEGQVDAGLGKTASSGEFTLAVPTDIIEETGQKMTVDGVEMEFLYAPNTEAPAEMHFYFPQFKALCMAENATHTLHNLYTLRGAKVRDAKAWAEYLNQSIEMFAGKTKVMFVSHHWPVWGQDSIRTHLEMQRDLYKYIHDQTLNLANKGYTMNEIAEMVKLPESLASYWSNRGYYGTVSHDVKAVYQRYLGWFDGNPANLNPLPPVEASKRYVEFMGGAEALLQKAQQYYYRGEYRWVAEVVNHLVFADPNNQAAKNLQADALEQLGFQAESGPWRNFYLTGALELRKGIRKPDSGALISADMIAAMTTDMFLDYMGIRLNGPKAAGKRATFNYIFTDTNEKYALYLQNGVLVYTKNKQLPNPDATLTTTRATLNEMATGKISALKAIASGKMKIGGKKAKFLELMALQDKFEFWFNIVTP